MISFAMKRYMIRDAIKHWSLKINTTNISANPRKWNCENPENCYIAKINTCMDTIPTSLREIALLWAYFLAEASLTPRMNLDANRHYLSLYIALFCLLRSENFLNKSEWADNGSYTAYSRSPDDVGSATHN